MGIELEFQPELTNEELIAYLVALQFKKAYRKKGVWYIKGDRPSYDRYTDALVTAYNGNADFLAVKIMASYDPLSDNITHKMFSLATAILKPVDGKKVSVDYVIFEDFRPSALDIANRYLIPKYGEQLSEIQVSAKNFKARAERALEAGRIITGSEPLVATTTTSETITNPAAAETQNPQILTNASGVYTAATAGDRYEEISIPFPGSYRFSAEVRLVRNEENRFVFGISVQNTGLNGYGGTSYMPGKNDTSYPKREEALTNAFTEILEIIGLQKTPKHLSEKTLKGLTDVEEFIHQFADKEGIALPEKMLADKPDTTNQQQDTADETAQDVSALLTQKTILQQLIDKLTDLEADTQGETEHILAALRLELEDVLEIEDVVTFDKELEHILEQQSDWVQAITPEAVRETFIETILYYAKALGYTPFHFPHASGFTILQKWTQLDEKHLDYLQQLIETYPQALELKKDANDVIQGGSISSDKATIHLLYLPSLSGFAISSFNPFHEEDIITYSGSAIPNGKLKKAIRYMKRHPERLGKHPKKEAPNTDQKHKSTEAKSILTDTQSIPNVLIPDGVAAPFDSGKVKIGIVGKVREALSHLLELTDAALPDTGALDLFRLSQMAHPTDYGFKVNRGALLKVWNEKGEDLFKALGYPTAPNYPYVNIHSGYQSVYPLSTIIGEAPSRWWAAIEHYRPIADMDTALEFIDEKIAELRDRQLTHTNPNTGKVKTKKEDKQSYRELGFDIEYLENSKMVVQKYIQPGELETKEEEADTQESEAEDHTIPEVEEIREATPEEIREQLQARGFPILFSGTEVRKDQITIAALVLRDTRIQEKLEDKTVKEYTKWIAILEEDIRKLKGKDDRNSLQSLTHRQQRISALTTEAEELKLLVAKEKAIFEAELLQEISNYISKKEKAVDHVQEAAAYCREQLYTERMQLHYGSEVVFTMLNILVADYLAKTKPEVLEHRNQDEYLGKTVAIMHEHYMKGQRLGKKKIEALQAEVNAPSLGALWEAVELSWLLWYKMLYQQPESFPVRLRAMVQFWERVQPTYAYSDSSKELYKQYSTPCPIGAIIAEYTEMKGAGRTFEPSAGNGLLVIGANPDHTHVNEIDQSRSKALAFQRFRTITHYNAAVPFPQELHQVFDVVVTNPPFAAWEDSKFDKQRYVQQYFHGQRGLVQHMRLEHYMAGLALHTLKANGRAAIIMMGHVHFGRDGYIEKYRPFFNWLFRHYKVDDIINMNSYKLYNKQGAVTKTMLILIRGRKTKPEGVAPKKEESPLMETMVDSFYELWERVAIHTPGGAGSRIPLLITQLKLELEV